MYNEIIDERYSVADEAVCDTFLLVLKEKGPDKITCFRCDKKGWHRPQHIYTHYENISGLITAIEDRTVYIIFRWEIRLLSDNIL